jgi:hypothetical protein
VSGPSGQWPKSLLTTTVTALGNDIKNHLACLLTALPCANNLNGLILRLVARDLDLGAGLLAEIVDGATARADDEPVLVSIVLLHQTVSEHTCSCAGPGG